EAELVVGAVGHVSGIGFATLLVIEIVNDDADGKAEEAIELAHPLRVALGQVVVDGHYGYTAPAERVQIDRESCDQRFSCSGLQFACGIRRSWHGAVRPRAVASRVQAH